MNFEEYQLAAARTIRPDFSRDKHIANFAMGLAGEAGETVDYLKKVLFHGHPLDKLVLSKELGDVLWYPTAIATVYGLRLEDIAQMNIEKLLKRYPDGFDPQRSIHRTE